jgi:hypothetical protein
MVLCVVGILAVLAIVMLPESTPMLPESTPSSFEPIILTGVGDTTTPPFSVTTNEWILDWSFDSTSPEYACFAFYMYPRGSNLCIVSGACTKDEGIEYGHLIEDENEFLDFEVRSAGQQAASGTTHARLPEIDKEVLDVMGEYYGTGEYYVEVLAANIDSWTVTIRPPGSEPVSSTGTSKATETPTPTAPTPTAPTWTEVISWEGSSIKDTETFSITANEWRIRWSTWPGQYGDMNFQIYVYEANGNLNSVAANIIGEGNDVSYVRGSGDYYLTINTGQPYAITIEQEQ